MIGLDLGGTKVAVAALDGRRLSDPLLEPTQTASTDTLLDQLTDLIDRSHREQLEGGRLDGVGLGVPSVIDFATGRAISSVNVPLRDVPLREELGRRLGVPVFVDNDATVAAFAESHDDGLRQVVDTLVMLTVGTGVGGGIVIGGQIFRGATGAAAELGHTLVSLPRGDQVPAAAGVYPQPASLEHSAAGPVLDRLGAEFAQSHPDSLLAHRRADAGPVLGADVVAAAHRGDTEARELVTRWAQWLGVGIANAIHTFDPEEVVIGGGAARAGELLREPAERIARSYLLPGLGERTRVRLARHGVRAGVIGAALLAVGELEKVPGVRSIPVGPTVSDRSGR